MLWQNLKAFAQVTVMADCSAVSNAFEILIDNSRSMSDRFNDVFESKLDVARLMAWQLSIAVNLGKDLIGLIGFTTYPNEIVTIGNVAISQTQFAQIQKSDAATSILEALATGGYKSRGPNLKSQRHSHFLRWRESSQTV